MKRIHHLHKKISLTNTERLAIRENLKVMVHERPIIRTNTPAHSFFAFRTLFSRSLQGSIGAFLFLVLAGGSVAYGAGNAVPGDMLYPVKVNLNEKIQMAFANTSTKKVKLHVALANERLKEAETLVAEGRLTPTATASLTKRVKAHVDVAQKETEDRGVVQKVAHDKGRTGLTVALKAHDRILKSLIAQDASSSRDTLLPLAVEITEQIDENVASTQAADSDTLPASSSVSTDQSFTGAEEKQESPRDTREEKEEEEERAIRATLDEVQAFIKNRGKAKVEIQFEKTMAPRLLQ